MNENVIVVVGGGTMGAGIASVVANAGYDACVIEPMLALHERIHAAGIRVVTSAATLPDSQTIGLVIEAVPERLDLKRAIFSDLAAVVSPDALLATNTSSLSVAEIFAGIAYPERTLGLHFFNPPPVMKLVEIVKSPITTEENLMRAQRYVERFGKIGVVAADTPGFIVNRVARPFYLEAMRALEGGKASVDEIDTAARDAGFRMGPFELMDLIGLDVNLATSESVYARTGAERLKPVEIQKRLVDQRHLGRKTGRGFYIYEAGRKTGIGVTSPAQCHSERSNWNSCGVEEQHSGSISTPCPPDTALDMTSSGGAVVETMVASILREARMLVDEGVASAENVNTAMKFGVNYPESVRI